MRLLPFDPFSARVLSLVLLGLIVLLSHARDPMRSSVSLVRNDGRGPDCSAGYVPPASQSGWGCGRVSRHPIYVGRTSATSF
jgi:hypothetical protein